MAMAVSMAPDPAAQSTAAEVAAYFGQHAPAVDRGERDVRAGLRWLAERRLLDPGLHADDPDQLVPIGTLIAQIAEQCLSSAFALWCHRMVMEYATIAVNPFLREALLESLRAVDVLGSTALGGAMAHVVLGVPLTVQFETTGDDTLVLDGRIAWASNLLTSPGAGITVTGATDHRGRRIVVAIPLDTPGLRVESYPPLLAMQSTRSASLTLDAVRLETRWIVADELSDCLARMRPRFLALQSSFCLGLSRAALRGAHSELANARGVFDDDAAALERQLVELEGRLARQLRQPSTVQLPMREFVQTRLDLVVLAQAATRLELTLHGGRAYRLDDAVGRRFREAAFLPIQAPTESQLRWELRQPGHP
ncbi:MAG: acyl-CoA/acyl-ACP dehydrogenase [Chloroflexi bacterium]|nr:acyl-CoA/acyl-ACP dehydrogenase [Chloroflexota bacterium]